MHLTEAVNIYTQQTQYHIFFLLRGNLPELKQTDMTKMHHWTRKGLFLNVYLCLN